MTIIVEESQDNQLFKRKAKKCLQSTCSIKMLKKRLPIVQWLPNYKTEYIIQDIIAGITVALTAIAQGIAYAVIAGLPPEYGLYASVTAGTVYIFLGSCYNITVGPTAIVSTLTAKLVYDYSADFAVLAAFLSGVVILLLGVLNLGFMMEFISMPVINGFTNAAALQIAASQLKSLFGLNGSSGSHFAQSMYNFFLNIKSAKLWEPIMGTSTIIMLILLKKLGEGCKRTDGIIKQMRWVVSLSRNAVVVVVGMVIAYIIKIVYDTEPLVLVGDIRNGLPEYRWPPFSTVIGNDTLNFTDMMQVLGVRSIVLPFVAIIETVAIAKAFAVGGRIDATQELIAIGLCNIIGSFGQSMPVTGSFARTALNHISGVKTQAGGITNVLLLIVALKYLTSTFYYIPKATLAGLIINAMFTMMDYEIVISLWKSSIKEFLIILITIIICLFFGLEYGIMVGVLIEALLLLYNVARPELDVEVLHCEKGDIMVITLSENVLYCAAEHVRQKLFKVSCNYHTNIPIIINGVNLKKIDYTAAYNLMSIIKDLDINHYVVLLNFNVDLKNKCLHIDSRFEPKFMNASSPLELTATFPK